MMQSLTKREKVLLCVLAGAVFGYLSAAFLIAPAVRAKSESAQSYEAVSERHRQAVQKIESVDALSQAYANARDIANRQKTQFPVENNAAQIDEIISALCKQAGLAIQSMQLGTPQTLEEESTAAQTDTATVQQTQQQEISAISPQMLKIPVSLVCSGDKDTIHSLVAAIEKREDMRVSSFQYDRSKSATLVIDVFVRQNITIE